jgi:hypothetical protein
MNKETGNSCMKTLLLLVSAQLCLWHASALSGDGYPSGRYYNGIGQACVVSGVASELQVNMAQAEDSLPAFPGAEGFGKYTTGGRGGKVIFVTSLNDDNNPGSLRYAVSQAGPRIIIFKVSGNIRLKSVLNINNGDVTIAGQTAPGEGITIRDYTVFVNADNVVIRFMRFRMGDETAQENDAIWGRNRKNIIIDHCSMSWSTDETASFYDNTNFTLQWSILSESLRNSVHNKGTHGYGGIWGGMGASFHHNILAHHDSRNPRFCGSRYSNKADLELVDFRNNTLYNWGANNAYAAEGGRYNMVNNYYKAGPASSNKSRIIQPYADDGSNSQPKGTYGRFYIAGNVVTASTANTADNWLGVNMHTSFGIHAPGVTINNIRSDAEFEKAEVTTQTAVTAYQRALLYAGASLKRDAVDARIVREVTDGSVTFPDGGNGSKNGLIDTQNAVGGWPDLLASSAPEDSDNDGMPDYWEDARQLNKYSDTDAQITTLDGKYPNIEVYMNSLVEEITRKKLEDAVTSALNPVHQPFPEPEIRYNQNTGLITVNHSNGIKLVRLFDINGSLLTSRVVNNQYTEIHVKPMGIIIMQLIDAQGHAYNTKINTYQ